MAGPRRVPRGQKSSVENPGRVMKRLLGYIFKYYGFQMICVLLCILISVLANLRGTMFMKTLIDDYIEPLVKAQSNDFSGLLHAILTMAVIYGVGIIATYSYNRIMVNVTQGTLLRLREELFNHMQTLPIRYFDTNSRGDIMSIYTNDIDTLRQMVSQSIPQLFNSFIMIVGTLISMIVLSVPLTIVTVVMVLLMLFVTVRIAKLSGKYFQEQQKNIGKVNGFIEEMMSGQKVVKVFCHEEESIKDFDELNEELFDSAYKANKYANVMMPTMAQMGNLSYVICTVIGAALVLFGINGTTIGTLVSFLQYNRSFNMPINQVSMQTNAIIMALAGADRVFKLLDEKPEEDEGYVNLVCSRKNDKGEIEESVARTGHWAWKLQDGSLKLLTGDVRFKDVIFGYNEEKIVLKDINLFAKPGQKIAFVGSTGAGKTTITNLINRFYEINSGKITYDGIDIKDIKKEDLRKSLGVILQDTHLFTGTIADNIRYGNLDATDEEVIAAAKLANAHSFIKHLPHGYDTVLTGDGEGLSQGQRQLLNIARAAVANPPVLIMDEATSSIDTRTEKLIAEGMDKLMEGRTVFVIAHRLSTIKNSQAIMVLEQGQIIERGNHDELLEIGGRYYQLYTGKAQLDAEEVI